MSTQPLTTQLDVPASADTPTRPAPARLGSKTTRWPRPLRMLLDLFSSVSWGLWLMAVALVYMSLGSAIPELRQAFELTEMQWFQTPLFNLIILLFVISVITVTVRRIPFNKYKLGVWMVHAGLVTLSVGAVEYFTLKVEGDVFIVRRNVVVTTPGGEQATFPGLVGDRPTQIETPAGAWTFQVANIEPNYRPLNEDVKAKLAEAGRETVFKLDLQVETPDGRRYVRTIMDGFAERAEDADRGGRAKTQINQLRFDEALRTELVYAPATHLYVVNSAAIYARKRPVADANSAAGEFVKTTLTGALPYYHEAYDPSWDLIEQDGRQFNRGPLDLPVTTGVDGLNVRVSGYLPYADLGRFFIRREHALPADSPPRKLDPANPFPAAAGPNPVLYLNVGERSAQLPVVLEAAHPDTAERATPFLTMRFRWIQDPAELEALAAPGEARLLVVVQPSRRTDGGTTPLVREVAMRDLIGASGVHIHGTPYTLQMTGLMPNYRILSGPRKGRFSSLVQVRVVDAQRPASVDPQPAAGQQPGVIRAIVAGEPDLTRDIDPDTAMATPVADDDILIEVAQAYPSEWVFVAGAQVPLTAIVRSPLGTVERVELKPGGKSTLRMAGEPTPVEVIGVFADATAVPVQIMPRPQREPLREVSRSRSLVRLELSRGDWHDAVWVPHVTDMHLLRDVDSAIVDVPDVGPVQLVYSRERRLLPNTVALDDFEHLKGIGGQVNADFVSRLAIKPADGTQFQTGEGLITRLNDPYWDGEYHYFQARYDPRHLASTTLLIANRHGLVTMTVGIVLMVLGMIWAFYIKPVLQRRAVTEALRRKGLLPQQPAHSIGGSA